MTVSKFQNIFITVLLVLSGFLANVAVAQQIMINEAMSSNSLTIYDEDGDTPDWIELYNNGETEVNLKGFGLSDTLNTELMWRFPAVVLGPKEHLLIFASDKNRTEIPLHWETVIDVGDTFQYIVPSAEPPSDWRTPGFDDSAWMTGKSGFGYGDGDDSTIVESVLSVFYRTTFNVDDPGDVVEAMLHMDYDDAFVAYINGTEIARGNISVGGFPAFDDNADNGNHEAQMYTGGQPEVFFVSNISDLLVAGENVFSVQAHNSSTGSSDLTSIPFLTFGHTASVDGEVSQYLQLTPESLHTDFKLTSDGETIYLTNADDVLIDTLYTDQLIANISIGSSPDGADNIAYFNEPTPGKPNASSAYSSFANSVEFSVEGGVYDENVTLELSSVNPDDSIYYTLDGSEPSGSHTLYEEPIVLDGTSVVRARVVKHNSVPGIINSATYLFNTNHQLPVISITTDPKNLWNYETGIYVMGPNAEAANPHFGANFWQDWEKPAHVEMYEPDGSQAFSLKAGIKIFGGWSRANAQKSLTIHARKSYGDGPIEYKLFSEKELDEFSSIVLRNSGNDWNNTMIRDGVLTSLFHENVDRQAYRPAVLYINGEYWGIQNIREKVNEHFIADNHDINSENVSLLELEGLPVYGDEEHYRNLIEFVNNNDLASSANYDYVATQMDISNFIYYQIGNIYIDNTDWPGNNIKFWRENSEEGQWKWITYDTDFGFGIWDYNRVNFNTLEFALDPFGPGWPNPPWSTLLFRRLINNNEFRLRFINTFADQLNTKLLSASVREKITYASSKISTEIGDHLNRWGGSLPYWNQKVSEMKQFADERPSNVRNHIIQQFNLSRTQIIKLDVNLGSFGSIQLNSLTLDSFPWSGFYFEGVPVQLHAIPQPGYRFIKWEGDVVSSAQSIEVDLTKSTSIKAVFALEDNELTSMVINEINYNSADDFDADDWVELYNRGGQPVDISGWVLKDDDDTHEFIFPENTVVPSDAYLVVCRNLDQFSALYPQVSNAIGNMDFGLSGSGDCVRLFTDDGTMVDDVCYGVTNPWPELPNGNGATLALDNPFADNTDPQNWYALSGNGNPGEENRLVSGIGDPIENKLVNYPNPFSGLTTMKYQVEKPGDVMIQLFDQHGKTVLSLFEGYQNAGLYNLEINIKGAPGLYIVKLRSADGVFVRKMMKK